MVKKQPPHAAAPTLPRLWMHVAAGFVAVALCVLLFVAPISITEWALTPNTAAPAHSDAPAPVLTPVVWRDGLHRYSHVAHDPSALPLLRWGIMFDAGSTGSRLHIYRFRVTDPAAAAASAATAPPAPVLEDEIFVEVKPGLSAYVPSGVGADVSSRDVGARADATAGKLGPDAAAESLRSLMDLCMDAIPSASHARTPISLRATAGLRLLGDEVAESILASIRTLFSQYPFVFTPGPTGDVQVMTGSEEGVFAWITVNYLSGRLWDHPGPPEPPQALVHSHAKTSAILDLGGASTQIVFEPEFDALTNLEPQDAARLYKLPYGSNEYYLYERSYLGFGLMEARRKIKASVETHRSWGVHPIVDARRKLSEASSGGAEESSSDDNEDEDAAASKLGASAAGVELSTSTPEGVPILYHPCLSDAHSESILSASGDPLVLQGHALGHASCAELARTLFEKEAPCTSPPFCSFGGHFALPIAGMFAREMQKAAHRHDAPAAAAAAAPAAAASAASPNPTASIYAFSYFYDRTLEIFDLPEERLPSLPGHEQSVGVVLRLERIRHLADQVCAYSSKAGGKVKSVAAVEAEKDAARELLLARAAEALGSSIDAKAKAGCTTVTVKARDGSIRVVVLPAAAAAAAASGAAGSTAAAAASASSSVPISAAAAASASADSEGACMVEESPDLSAASEAAHAALAPPIASMIVTNPYLCLDLTYAHTLLHYGYDLPESVDLHVMKRLKHKEIGWCLGAMLSQMAQRGW